MFNLEKSGAVTPEDGSQIGVADSTETIDKAVDLAEKDSSVETINPADNEVGKEVITDSSGQVLAEPTAAEVAIADSGLPAVPVSEAPAVSQEIVPAAEGNTRPAPVVETQSEEVAPADPSVENTGSSVESDPSSKKPAEAGVDMTTMVPPVEATKAPWWKFWGRNKTAETQNTENSTE